MSLSPSPNAEDLQISKWLENHRIMLDRDYSLTDGEASELRTALDKVSHDDVRCNTTILLKGGNGASMLLKCPRLSAQTVGTLTIELVTPEDLPDGDDNLRVLGATGWEWGLFLALALALGTTAFGS